MDETDQTEFETALDELEGEGSAILIVGTVPDSELHRVTETLQGDPENGPKRQLFVTTPDRVAEIETRVADRALIPPRQGARAITVNGPKRSAAATDAPGAGSMPVTAVEADEIDALAQSMLETVNEFERLGAGLEPGELRVSVETLTTLIDVNGQEAVFRMIHLLNHIVRENDGLAYYHLPVERESAVVRMFASLFDAVVELRLDPDGLKQRWHVENEGITSDWMPA
jgi:hypothetical protein